MKIPSNFNPEMYLQLNPDLVAARVDPFQHYIDFGAKEGRLYDSPQVIECRKINTKLETILVVSHEASLTGAPILTHNIVKKLSETYNVILLLLGGGVLIPNFIQCNVCHIECINQRVSSSEVIETVVRNIVNKFEIKFAILNSIECSSVVEFLAKKFIAVITLVHEFSSYTRPLDNLGRVLFWSTELVFSSKLIYENACLDFPDLVNRNTHILPQGKCNLPKSTNGSSFGESSAENFNSIFNTVNTITKKKIVLGVGSVHMRKGVDHFIECANLISSHPRFNQWRFIWIGKGYDPELDGNYSIFLKDQIQRSGLVDRLTILGETGEIMKAYQQSEILVIPSRLDPMPNVSLDAISLGMPLVCYDKTTGLADILKSEGLGEHCVADYMNTHSMAEKIINIIDNEEIRDKISTKFLEINKKYFNFDMYISKVIEIANTAALKAKQNESDCQTILTSELFEPNLGAFAHLQNSTIDDQVVSYVNSWSIGLGPPRKGLRGFHPGIYSENIDLNSQGINPLAHYIISGMPKGPWNYRVISSVDRVDDLNLPLDNSIALHVHVFYIDLFPEIIERILENKIRPDLFITVTNSLNKTTVEYLLKNYEGNIISIEIITNLGRNIKPFIDTYKYNIKDKYKYVGHLHTKKSSYECPIMGKTWANSIFNNLLGSPSNPMLDLILGSMEEEDCNIGIVIPEDPNIIGWDGNLEVAQKLIDKLHPKNKLPDSFLFPIGAMFIARSDAINFIENLNLTESDYPKEPVPRDGTILHAIERLIGFPKAPFQVTAAYLEGTKR